jgi:hypothetical protein
MVCKVRVGLILIIAQDMAKTRNIAMVYEKGQIAVWELADPSVLKLLSLHLMLLYPYLMVHAKFGSKQLLAYCSLRFLLCLEHFGNLLLLRQPT